MFNFLSSKIENVFSAFGKKAVITNEDLNKALREIRVSLLEADVALPVVKKLFSEIEVEAINQQIVKSVSPKQMIVKIVHDKLEQLLQQTDQQTQLCLKGDLSTIFMIGLQGVGKTTTSAKLAHYLQSNLKKNVLLLSLDSTRAAAYEQLETLAKENNIGFYKHDNSNQASKVKLTRDAMVFAKQNNYDTLLVDTAGRLSIDSELLDELKVLTSTIVPDEILLVADSMIGQASVDVALQFQKAIKLSGLILTKADGDARGGALLSTKYITQLPVKFLGIGERINDLEIFSSKRIADRILQMGDIVTLVEKFSQLEQDEDAQKTAKRVAKGLFTMDDLKKQLEQLIKLGGVGSMLGMIPGLGKLKNAMASANVDNNVIKQQIAIIDSMTKKERKSPNIINGSRRKRIAKGSGNSIEKVNRLIKQYDKTAKILKQFKKGGLKSLTELTKLQHNL